MRKVPILVIVLLVSGCFGGDPGRETGAAPDAPPTFDPADPRLPHFANGSTAWKSVGSLAAPGFPLFGDPVRMNQTFGAARETSLAVGPAGSGLRFACDPLGVPNTQNGQSAFYLSTDNGTTWRDIDVEGDATDPRNYAFEGGDCDVEIGPDGTLWTADSWLGSLSIGRSLDGGETWEGTPLGGPAPVADRPWLVAKSGTLHLTYQDVQFGMPSAIWYTRLALQEGPMAFTPAVLVASASPEGGFTWTGNLVVSDDAQDMWSVYTRRMGPVTTDLEGSGPETVWVARSTDGGLTWTSIRISDRPNPASFLYASIAQDAGGILHVVFAQRTDDAHPVFHSYSTDQGTTWSDPAPMFDHVYATSPWVAGGQAGQAIVQWFGTPDVDVPAEEQGWYTYWATVHGAADGNVTYLSGTTTPEPIFIGEQGETPEFNMVRTDAQGFAHLGTSHRIQQEDNSTGPWMALYQAQIGGPAI